MLLVGLGAHGARWETHGNDDGTNLARERCRRHSSQVRRKRCVDVYLAKKTSAVAAPALPNETSSPCVEPADSLDRASRSRLDSCLHAPERDASRSTWLHAHIVQPPQPCKSEPMALSAALRTDCLSAAGEANWTGDGLVDIRPECGRRWLQTSCARRLFEGRDALFIGNSVVRRQV